MFQHGLFCEEKTFPGWITRSKLKELKHNRSRDSGMTMFDDCKDSVRFQDDLLNGTVIR